MTRREAPHTIAAAIKVAEIQVAGSDTGVISPWMKKDSPSIGIGMVALFGPGFARARGSSTSIEAQRGSTPNMRVSTNKPTCRRSTCSMG
jgi:hypothetical protein